MAQGIKNIWNLSKQRIVLLALLLPASLFSGTASADVKTLIDDKTLKAFADETSGISAKRNLDQITLYHRTRGSKQYHKAAEHVLAQLKAYGFADAQIMEFVADGKTMFGTQKSRFAWDVDFAELWELDEGGDRLERLASWEAMPLSVAQDSLSGSVTTTLIDIGAGTSEADYEGKDIAGKLVLTESQPGAVADLAVKRYGATGIVSYAPNQRTAWWKEDDNLVRWGHLESFPDENSKTFGFMITLGQARKLQARLSAGETIRLDAQIQAEHSVGKYDLVTATIPGSDPALSAEEIAFTCHLDHPRPGANDNASGCVAILESARSMMKMINEGRLPAPKRTIRFIWPAEIEGSIILLAAKPDLAARIKANIHMDMVGGGLETKAVFRIGGSPDSIPSFIPDVAHEIGAFVNEQTLAFASGEPNEFPLFSSEGGKEPLMAVLEGFSLGSDHQVLSEGTWGIPGAYFHDWPDRYIHTNYDTAAMIDPTKLKRAAFIGSATAWFLANMDSSDAPAVFALLKKNAVARTSVLLAKKSGLNASDIASVTRAHWALEAGKIESVAGFSRVGSDDMVQPKAFLANLAMVTLAEDIPAEPTGRASVIFERNSAIKGPMNGFGYNYLDDHLAPEKRYMLRLSGEHAYEALNFVDGKRTVQDIRDRLTAEFGPVSIEDVFAYFTALESIDVLSAVQ